MTTEQLRQQLLSQADRLLALPHFMVDNATRHCVTGQRLYWQQAGDAELDKLLALIPMFSKETEMAEMNATQARQQCEAQGISAQDCDKLHAAGVNWPNLLALLQAYGPQIITLLVSLFGSAPMPSPLPQMTAKK